MDEVIALEEEIMSALPRCDAAADMFDRGHPIFHTILAAHDILCNGWSEQGSRLDRLRTIAAELRRFA